MERLASARPVFAGEQQWIILYTQISCRAGPPVTGSTAGPDPTFGVLGLSGTRLAFTEYLAICTGPTK